MLDPSTLAVFLEEKTNFEILEALATALEINDPSFAPNLLAIVKAWPKLQEPIKQAVMALVNSSHSQ